MTNESWRMKYCAAPSNGMAVGRILIQLGGAQGKGVIWRGADVVSPVSANNTARRLHASFEGAGRSRRSIGRINVITLRLAL